MKNPFLIILSFFIFSTSFAQIGSCRINLVNPQSYLKEVDSLRQAKKYDLIINDLKKRIKSDSTQMWHYYQLACYYSLKKNIKKSFSYLYKAIEMNACGDDILSDTDFEILHNTKQWKLLKDTLVQIYLNKYPDINKKELSVKLWLMGIEDQSTRSLRRNLKKKSPPQNSKEWEQLNKLYIQKTKERSQFIMSLVKKGYWPLYSDVGEEAGDATLYIVQHSNNKRLFKKALPLLKNAIEKKEANGGNYALMIDRYLMMSNKKQIYGTQIINYRDETNNNNWSGNVFWPIENEKEVNKRRKSVGLQTIEEYGIRFNIKYIYKPENENQKLPSKF